MDRSTEGVAWRRDAVGVTRWKGGDVTAGGMLGEDVNGPVRVSACGVRGCRNGEPRGCAGAFWASNACACFDVL